MRKTLTKHGDNFALEIEKPILDLLGASSETLFEITTDGKVLILSPIQNDDLSKEISEAEEEINKKYKKAFKKLAK